MKWLYISKRLRLTNSSFKTLRSSIIFFSYVVRWLDIQKERLTEETNSEAEIDRQMLFLINEVMSNIRFPMMDPRQLAGLLLSPLVKNHKEFFFEKMAVGVAFHEGNIYSEINLMWNEELLTSFCCRWTYRNNRWTTTPRKRQTVVHTAIVHCRAMVFFHCNQ